MTVFSGLTVKVRIMLILGSYIFGIIGMGYVSYDYLRTTEEKTTLLELAYNLNNIILEARRYEKNFLLYFKREALVENHRYLDQAADTQELILARVGKLKVTPMFREFGEHFAAYRAGMREIEEQTGGSGAERQLSIDRIRELGKRMTDLSEELVAFERDRIHEIIRLLKGQLVVWSAMAFMLGVLLPWVLVFKIFRPLRIIRRATDDIAQGRFNRIEVVDTNDEMQQMMVAFNTMVQELERRQDQLVQSKKLSSIGTLTAGVAHQLNNPLNNISTSCQIAIDELAGGDRAILERMLANIEQETLRARDVVKGLLGFARAREVSLRPANLGELVQRTIRLVQSQVPAGIEVTVDIPHDLIVPMDSQRIQEALLNLVINAGQAIVGPGRINIRARHDEERGGVELTVSDTGPGIPEEIQGQLFDPFFTTKEEGQGTGLGLSVVYGIIQQHHGNIGVVSEPGAGTAFVIFLPGTVPGQQGHEK